ncbi:MAG: hypothetical protein NVSMB19_24090 [Vulcanimicrobiaceae bacterium]
MTRRIFSTLIAFGLTVATASAQPAAGPGAKTYGFVPHAAFFSLESKQANLIDPQAFVADPAATAGPGPQGIVHVAGFRPAYGVEDPATPVVNAQGRALGFNFGRWFGANGSVTLKPAGSTTAATFAFGGLIPNGRYSLFENHFSESGVTFTPLDGNATTNSFTASRDGHATLALTIPGTVTRAEGLLLVYHSDGHDHGMERGQIGITAHHQLIVRVP